MSATNAPSLHASPYVMERPPSSAGKVLLSVAFHHYCVLHWGMSGEEIAAAFAGGGEAADRERLAMAVPLLGGVFNRAMVRSWARPFGGGEPVELKASAWELDNCALRFATSALDPARPFDATAPATHWLFVDVDGWNEVLEASVGAAGRAARSRRPAATPEALAEEPRTASCDTVDERFLRLPDVKLRTGMSRSTIYRRMEDGRFPRSVPLSGNIAAWRERDVVDWMESR